MENKIEITEVRKDYISDGEMICWGQASVVLSRLGLLAIQHGVFSFDWGEISGDEEPIAELKAYVDGINEPD